MHFEDPSPQNALPAASGSEAALPAQQPSDSAAPSALPAAPQLSANVNASQEPPAAPGTGVEPTSTPSVEPARASVLPMLSVRATKGGARHSTPEPEAASAPRGGRRFGVLAASLAIAIGIGAAAGAAGVAGVTHLVASPPPAPAPVVALPAPVDNSSEIKALRETIAQMKGSIKSLNDAVGALKNQSEGANKGTQAQIGKLADAVDKLERAQAEPKARLGKLTEAVEKLERRTVAAPAQPAAAMAADTTGSVRPAPLPPLHKPPIEGWAVRDVYEGIALVQGRLGSMEVAVGDEIRGLGRVQDIRRQEGRWVVVTTKGVIR